jgi:hypothetical protein
MEIWYNSLTTFFFNSLYPIVGSSPSSLYNMRFSSATTLFSLASIAQAAPALHQRETALQYDTSYGAKYQAGIFYVNWVRNSTAQKASTQLS